jgi:hypothetical protein
MPAAFFVPKIAFKNLQIDHVSFLLPKSSHSCVPTGKRWQTNVAFILCREPGPDTDQSRLPRPRFFNFNFHSIDV